MDHPIIAWERMNEDGESEYIRLPARYEVCPRCEGRGKHVNPSIDGHGLTSEDFEDPEFREDYFRGVYDVACHECRGVRVVRVLDEDRCDPELLKEYLDHLQDEAYYDQITRMEREMGA